MRGGGGGDWRRGALQAEQYLAEAFVSWNGPPVQAADGINRAALDDFFGSEHWHFKQNSWRGQNGPFADRSEVLQRHDRERGRLHFLADATGDAGS